MQKKKKEEKVAATIPIYNCEGKEVETFEPDSKVFDGRINKAVIYQVVVAYNANRRQGTASTKTISEVSGGGKKPWAQKGTGRARHASIRSPLWPGGGKIFGPHPRDYRCSTPKKVNRLALASCLASKLKEKNLIGIDSLTVDEPKTKKFKAILSALKLKGKTLFILDSLEENVRIASRNLKEVTLKDFKDFNALDLLASDKVVISKAALVKLPERIRVR